MNRLPQDCLFEILTFLTQDPAFDAAVLLRVSREWFAVAGPMIYANPAKRILLQFKGREYTLHHFKRLINTLLHCASPDPSVLAIHQLFCNHIDGTRAPLLDRPPTTNYIKWIAHWDKEWSFLQYQYLISLPSGAHDITFQLLRSHPGSARHLTVDANIIGQVYSLVSGLTNVRSLELIRLQSPTQVADALWLAGALHAEHGVLSKFKLATMYHEQLLEGKSLDLSFLHSIRELELGGWSDALQLTNLPVANLRHLHIWCLPSYTIKQLGALLNSCPLLESLAVNLPRPHEFRRAVHDVASSNSAASTRTVLPRLHSLYIKGDSLTIPPALEEALAVWGGQLESLTIELTGGLSESYGRLLGWSIPLPRLRRLSLLDKAPFALNGKTMQCCGNVTYLKLHIDAEQEYLHSPAQGYLPYRKWTQLWRALAEMDGFLTNLKELRCDGCWIGCDSIARCLTQLHSLERLVIGTAFFFPTVLTMTEWLKTMPRLRYALLPTGVRGMGCGGWRKYELADWLSALKRAGLVVEVQERRQDVEE
ncbi:hypothetical protein BGW42_003136 [Actinomortierella wolfii]|nr:hypothetical protein BGW42_003136 [Actinomortierella wolfii]